MAMNALRRCLLVDDIGRVRAWPGARGSHELVGQDVDFDFPAYAVRNLGYVSIFESPDATRIWLRPLLVADATARALVDHMASNPRRRFVISYFDEVWQHAICGSREKTFETLFSLLADRAGDKTPDRFMATRRSIQGILAARHDPLAPLLNLWMDGSAVDDLPDLLRRLGLYDRAMIVERDPTSGRFVFRHSGRGIELYDRAWPAVAVGRAVDDQPDRAYGRWIAAACADIDAHQVPRFELVHALVGGSDGLQRQWRYERLMIPWRVHARRMVMSISRPSHERQRVAPG